MPTIVSNGGGATASIGVAEDRLGVTRVTATDPNPVVITYSIVGGSDQSLFQINAASGLLSFISVPNFEAPADADHDNAYVVQVRASNGSQSVDQTITVNVSDVNDITGGAGADVLVGGAAAEVLDGFAGADSLTGNGGADMYLFSAPTDGVDVLRDFWSHEDKIGLDQIGFGIAGNGSLAVNGVKYVVGTSATANAPTIIFNPSDFTFQWDADGTGPGAPVVFARFDMGSTVVWAGSQDLGTHGLAYQVAGIGDFNHDGTSDVLWRNSSTGQVDLWLMANGNWSSSVNLGTHGPDFQVAGVGDFNHDGTSDVLWRNNTTGVTDLWLMANGNWSASVALGSHGGNYQVAGVGDFNHDGTSDVLWRNPSTGQVDLWLMANGNWSASVDLGSHGPNYQIAGIGDFNHDGTSDVLWRNSSTGQVDLWLMANGNWSASVDLGTHGPDYQVAGVGDFNNDGTSDILWRNPTTGQVDIWLMANGNWAASSDFGSLSPDHQVAGVVDFNGDGTSEVLWRNANTGAVHEWRIAQRPLPDASDFSLEGNIVPAVSIPVDTNGATNSVVEGDPAGTTVGLTASSTNPSGDPVTYSLSDSAGGRFAIDPNSGVVTVGNAGLINFETASGHAYNITVLATSGTLTSSRVFSISVGDVAPGTPSDNDAGANTVLEGATTGTTVGVTVQASDVNGGPLSYSLTDDAGGRFQINTVTGVVSVSAAGAATIDYETAGGGTHNYSITAQATDGLLTSATQSFSIGVTNAPPTVPVDSNGAAGGTIQEGSATGTLVGITASSTDPAGTTVSYSLTDSAGGRFQIDSSSGVVSAGPNANLIDFETGAASYNITVRASDSSGAVNDHADQTFAVAVTNANPSTPTDANGAANTVAEGVASGQATGLTVQATDPGGTAIIYSLTDDANGRFQINSSSGVVTTGPNANLIDFESSSGGYNITAQASDGAGGTSSQTFSIGVTDVAPANWSDANAGGNLVVEDAANGTLVGVTAHATDVNGGTVVYSFAAAADSANGAFAVDSSSGVVTVADHTKVDFESSGGSYNILVTGSTVGGTATSTNPFTITVQDVAPTTPVDNDPTADSGSISGSVVEGAGTGTAVGITAHSTDVNSPSSAVTYSLSNDAGGLFAINTTSGVVTVTATGATGIDFESTGPGHTYSITVVATDGTQTSNQSFTIAVTDAAPSQPTDSDATANTVSTTSADNSPVGVTLSSTDPNTGTVTYALTDTHSNDFDINPSTGVVFLKAGHQDLTPFAGTFLTITGVAKDPSLATSVSQDFQIFVANNQLNLDLDLNNSTAAGNAYLGTGANAFTEQGSAKPIVDSDVTITNVGNPGVTNATSATIVLTNTQIGDALTISGALPAGISSTTTTSAGTITLTLTGTASYANYQTALQQIRFSTTGDPTADAPNPTDRLIHVTVTDSTGSSPFALSTIQITPVNDAPILLSNGSPATVNYTENALATALLANGTITDPDHPGNFSTGSFTVAITANSAAGDQIVLLGGTNFELNGATLLHNGTAVGTVSGLGTTSAAVTAFTAAATPTVVNELAHAFGFQNSSENPATALNRTVTFTFNDGAHTGAGALNNAVVVTQAVHVIAVNDAPVAANGTVSGAEDAAGIAGSAVATDVDNASVTYSLVGANGGAAHGTVSFTNASTGAYTYIPAADFNGTDTFTFKANDGSLDSNNATITVTVTEVNDPPVASADSIGAINEDSGAYVIPFATLTGNDNKGAANEFSQNLTVTSVSNPVGGTVQIVGGDVVFTPTANFNGPASFDYKVTDDGTTNGISDPQTSTASATASFTINAVNDAPVNTVPFATQAITENAANVAISGISFSDIDGGADETVQLSTLHGNLHVTTSGTATISAGANDSHTLTLSGSIADINTVLGTLNYSPDSNFTGSDTLTVLTNDGGDTGSPGALTDTDTVAIQVSTAIHTGLSGELFYVTRESTTPGDNVVGQINSDGTGVIHFSVGTDTENDIGVDTAVGYYFVLDSLQNLTSFALGGHTAADTIVVGGAGNAVDAIAVDTFYDVIYASVVGATQATTGIKEFTYDAAGNLVDTGNFLINQTTQPSFAQAIDMSIDSADHLLYYVNDDLNAANAIYVVDVSGTFGAGATPATTADDPPVTLLSSTSQFPGDPLDVGYNGGIMALAVDDRATSSGNDDIIYFLTTTGDLYYIVRSAGTTATLVTGAPTLTEVGAHTGLSFDSSTHQLWITNQDHTTNNDSIIKAQLNAAGTAITGTTAYDLTALTGVVTPDGATVPGQTAFNELPVLTIKPGTFTEGAPSQLAADVSPTDQGFKVFDPDILLTSLTITVTGGFAGSGDTVTVDPLPLSVGQTSNTTDANGNITVVLSGLDTLADYMGLVNNGVHFNSGDNPTNFGHNTTRTITWHVSDGSFGDPHSDGNTKVTTLTVNGQNDPPVAQAGSNSGNEDHSIAGQAVATDVDNTPAQLTYSLTGANGGAVHGTVTITAAGAYLYTPDANYNGPDSFQFHANDGTVDGNDGTISITVNAVNDAPVVTATTLAAVNEDNIAPPGETIANLFSGHFTDVDAGSSLAGIAVSGNTADSGTQGIWEYSLNGTVWSAIDAVSDASALALTAASFIRFVPALNFNGVPPALSVYGLDDTFAGTFTTSGSPSLIDASVNGGTTAISDNSVAISTSVTSVNDLPALDLDANNSSGATVADFQVNYTVSGAPAAIADIDTTITDADNTTIASATVTLTNAQTNDTLAISGALPAGISAVITPGAGTITVALSGSASLAAYQTALHQVVFNNPLAAGTPAGDRTVTVVVNDGTDNSNTATTTIHVTQDTAPVAVNDGAAISAGNATVIGTPATANDTDAQDPSSALVVSAVRTGTELGSGTAGTVGNALVGTYGALTLNFDGSYTYQLDNNNAAVIAAGSTDHLHDFFTYTVRDTAGLTDLAQIDIDVTGANDPPVANPDAVSATEKGGLNNATAGVDPSGNVITDVGPGHDSDPDNDPLTVQGVAAGTQVGPLSGSVGVGISNASNFGTLTINSNGGYSYVVNNTNATVQGLRTSAQTLTDTFSYTINDGPGGHTATTQVTVTIHGQDDNPVANNDTASATEAGGTANGTAGTNPSGNVLTGAGGVDTDVDTVANGETQTVQGVESGSHPADVVSTGVATGIGGSYGTLTVNSNGSFNYVVNQSLADSLNSTDHPTDVFTYTMRDTDGATSTALVTVTVNGANDAPVANNDGTFVVLENRATTPAANVLTNDTDVDTAHVNLTAIKNTDTAHGGTVTVNTDGTFSVSYASNSNYLGTDTFTYHTNDNGTPNLSSAAATVTLDVQPLVWYINKDSASATEDGSLANPFKSIANFNTANAGATHPDIIYLQYGNAGGTGVYSSTDGINLTNGQTLLGQGVDLTYTKTDTTVVTLLDADNTKIPTIQVTGGAGNQAVQLAQNNTLKGFNIDTNNAAAIGIEDDNLGGGTTSAGTVGTLNIAQVGIGGIGKAIDIDQGGTLNVSLSDIASTGSNSEGIQLGGVAGALLGGSFAVTGTTAITNANSTGIQVSNTAANASFNFGTSTSVTDSAIGSGHAGNGIDLSTGIGNTNGFSFGNLAVTTDGGFALKAVSVAGANTSTLTFGATNSLSATGGAAADITSTALSGATFGTVSSSGSSTYGINLVNQTSGTFTASGGTIGTADTAGVHISGGTAAASIASAINSSNGNAVDISGHSGGQIDLSGAINHTSGGDKGIVVSGNTGGTINFTGQTAIASTTANGVDLTSNTGATINFNAGGNGLDITTSSGTGFNATGGGTVNVQGAGNSINSTSATALNIANTTIGASNVTFHDISSGNNTAAADPVSGIILNTTGASGHLTVTGDGNASVGGNSSGGTIQNVTDYGISLTSTLAPSFTNMNIHDIGKNGIDGFGVTNFSLINSTINHTGTASIAGDFEVNGIAFVDRSGANDNTIDGTVTITGNTISDPERNAVMIETYAGTISNLNISSNTISAGTTNARILDGVHVFAQNLANITTGTINNNTISGFRFLDTVPNPDLYVGGNGIRVAAGNQGSTTSTTLGTSLANPLLISGNDIDNVGSNMIAVTYAGHNGTSNVKILNNGTNANPMSNAEGLGISLFFGGNGTFNGLIDHNVLTGTSQQNQAGSSGIGVQSDNSDGVTTTDVTNSNFTISNNTVGNTSGNGILATGINNAGTMNVRIIDNNVTDVPDLTARYGIRVQQSNVGTQPTVNLEIHGNTTAGGSGITGNGIGVRKQDPFTFGIEGLGATTSSPEAYINSQNPSGHGTDKIAGTNFTNTTVPDSPQMAAMGQGPGAPSTLSYDMLSPILVAAIANWVAAGASDEQLARLSGAHITIADLPNGYLGDTSPSGITIDANAAGWGWFIDPTPTDNSEFGVAHSSTELAATDAAAGGHIDLLTTLMHELGHIIGLPEADTLGGVMDETLNLGIRRLPSTADVEAASTNDGSDLTQAEQTTLAQVAQMAEAALPPGAAAPEGTPITAGTAGNDTFHISQGGTVIVGGAGADTFAFDQAVLTAPTPVAHLADYSAGQGDVLDFSALQGTSRGATALTDAAVRAVEDASGTFATVQVDAGAGHWVDVAQLDGMHPGDAVNVVVNPLTHAVAQIHADWHV